MVSQRKDELELVGAKKGDELELVGTRNDGELQLIGTKRTRSPANEIEQPTKNLRQHTEPNAADMSATQRNQSLSIEEQAASFSMEQVENGQGSHESAMQEGEKKESQNCEDVANTQADDDAHEWLQFIEESKDGSDSVYLEVFLDGQARFDKSKEHMEKVLEEANSALENILKQLFETLVVPLHESQRETLDSLESDIKHLLISNHRRREKMSKMLADADKRWKSTFELLTAQILDPNHKVEKSSKEPVETNSLSQTKETVQSPDDTDDHSCDQWESILSDPCWAENTRIFLNGRDRLVAAEERFALALDKIHDQWTESNHKSITTLADIFVIKAERLDTLENDVKSHMLNNHRQRMKVQDLVQSSANRAQGLFSNLLARVAQFEGNENSAIQEPQTSTVLLEDITNTQKYASQK